MIVVSINWCSAKSSDELLMRTDLFQNTAPSVSYHTNTVPYRTEPCRPGKPRKHAPPRPLPHLALFPSSSFFFARLLPPPFFLLVFVVSPTLSLRLQPVLLKRPSPCFPRFRRSHDKNFLRGRVRRPGPAYQVYVVDPSLYLYLYLSPLGLLVLFVPYCFQLATTEGNWYQTQFRFSSILYRFIISQASPTLSPSNVIIKEYHQLHPPFEVQSRVALPRFACLAS